MIRVINDSLAMVEDGTEYADVVRRVQHHYGVNPCDGVCTRSRYKYDVAVEDTPSSGLMLVFVSFISNNKCFVGWTVCPPIFHAAMLAEEIEEL